MKLEPSDSEYQAMGRTNPWRVSWEASHETVAFVPRHMVPGLPP